MPCLVPMIGVLVAGLALAGCREPAPCPSSAGPDARSPAPADAPLYVGSGDPYWPGPLTVRTVQVARCEQGAPVPMEIHTPRAGGAYPVVVFQHGFMLRNEWYSEVLRHLASHGFVVVAPQMYEPGIGPELGQPTVAAEAETAGELIGWLPGHLSALAGVDARTDVLGLSGHSRGGRVAWSVLSADLNRARAIAGVDPVDSTGVRFSGPTRLIQGEFAYAAPSLVIGAGLGGDCAPVGRNYEQFFAACPSPAWEVVAVAQGHADMLDDLVASAAIAICPSGPDHAGMRRLTAGLLVAFFRGSLQGDASAYVWLTDTVTAPVEITAVSK